MSTIVHDLSAEAEAARALLANVKDILAGDDDAIGDAIEGETNLKEAMARAVERMAEIDALAEAIKTQRDNLAARASRLEAQGEAIRAALQSAMAAAEMARLELAAATLSRRKVPPKVVVEDETKIPSFYWKRADPKLDLAALKNDMKNGTKVPGAAMGDPSETISIRWR